MENKYNEKKELRKKPEKKETLNEKQRNEEMMEGTKKKQGKGDKYLVFFFFMVEFLSVRWL